jgi:hypothetical protein
VRRLLVSGLAVDPAFGAYEPLLAVIRTSGAEYPYDAIAALRGHMRDPKVKKLMLERIKNPGTPQRSNYITAYLAEAPKEELPQFAVYLRERDEAIADATFIAILNRDAALASALAIREFDAAPGRVKTTMVNQFRFDPEKNGAAGLAMLRKAATLRGDPGLKQAALSKIMEYPSSTPAGWDLLSELAAHEGDPRVRDQMEQKLLFQIGTAYPQLAEAYYARAMKEKSGSVRDAAINSLLGLDGPKDARVKQVAALLHNPVGGSDLARVVLMSVNQYISIRQGWNFEQEELKDIIARGTGHTDPQVRAFAYNIMAEGVKQDVPGYAEELRKLLLNEPIPRAQSEGQRALDEATK